MLIQVILLLNVPPWSAFLLNLTEKHSTSGFRWYINTKRLTFTNQEVLERGDRVANECLGLRKGKGNVRYYRDDTTE
jgi:hypothetical protein